MKILGIRKIKTTLLNPKSNGICERFIKTLGRHLKLMVEKDQSDWPEKAQLFLMDRRAMPHAITGISSAMLMFG